MRVIRKKEKEITFKTIDNAFTIDDIPELHDRIIVGSAMGLDLKVKVLNHYYWYITLSS